MTLLISPAPWSMSGARHRLGELPSVHQINDANGIAFAFVSYSGRTREEHLMSLSDGRLIAAAPDLHAALLDALSGLAYIRTRYGRLEGVGWDRTERTGNDALSRVAGFSVRETRL